MRFVSLLFLCFVSTLSAAAQSADLIAQKKAEMKKVEAFVGRWEGTGWKMVGPKREEMTGSETVQRKLDGLALLIEGRFTDSAGVVKHESLGIMSFDDKVGSHRFKSFLGTGASGEFELMLVPGGFQWGFPVDAGQVRFSIKIEDGTWFEIGEFSRDGKTWIKTLEMTLKRVQ